MLVSLLLTLAVGTATAQRPFVGLSGGVGAAYGFVAAPVGVQVGVEGVGLPQLDLRVDAELYLTGTGLELGLTAIWSELLPVPLLEGYAGLGPRYLFGGGGGRWGGGAIAGVDVILDPVLPNLALFGEVAVAVFPELPNWLVAPTLAVGAKWRF